jgi:protein gp37
VDQSLMKTQAEAKESQIALTSTTPLRPHAGCDYLSPGQAHQMNEELQKRWKKAQTDDV